ncbi:MAG: hypothetical protein HYV35_02030 [Lentisphaerae bacterium]|nr:hypothetical protein [Lentisphaerota bacterium]
MNMAFLKKNLVFWLCLAVTAGLLLGALAGLFSAQRRYSRQARALDLATMRLQQLYRREIFPAAANVRKETENLKDIVDQYNELNELLRAGQADPQPMEAAKFMQLLEHTLRQLRDRLQNARVKFPERYAFGFDRYAGGRLPAPGDIPRLVQQLKIIETLCAILREAAVAELVAIERESFEQAAGAAGGRRGAPPSPAAPPVSDIAALASCQHFKITVKAAENAVLTMLTLLAGGPMFMVVTRIEVTNPNQGSSAAGPAPTTDAAHPRAAMPGPAAEERRVILGREELEVKLDLDVYQFAPSLAFSAEGTSVSQAGKEGP